MLEVKNLACGYGGNIVAKNINFTVKSGEITCILGRNGIGKTTLFKSMLGHIRLIRGEVLLNGRSIFSMPKNKLAKYIGYVPQAHTPPFPFSVLDVVIMGRTSHLSMFSAPSRHDEEIAFSCLETLGIGSLSDKIYTQISGGEMQMVLIARALAQEPEILIMDEPTANLDFGNQIKMLQQIKSLAQKGLAIVMTTHFPDHVFVCNGNVVIIKDSDTVINGKASEVISSGLLKDIYGIDVEIINLSIRNKDIVTCIPC